MSAMSRMLAQIIIRRVTIIRRVMIASFFSFIVIVHMRVICLFFCGTVQDALLLLVALVNSCGLQKMKKKGCRCHERA